MAQSSESTSSATPKTQNHPLSTWETITQPINLAVGLATPIFFNPVDSYHAYFPQEYIHPYTDMYCTEKAFSPAQDIPSLSGRVILVTGGNTGIGYETIHQLAFHQPRHIYLAARSPQKASEAISSLLANHPNLSISHLPLDLSSIPSIRSAAATILTTSPRLDILINNAGIMGAPASDLTPAGYEPHLGVNHLGPALFTHLLMPLLLRTAALPDADVRTVWLSSEAHHYVPSSTNGLVLDPIALSAMTDSYALYGQSKLANILHARSMAARYPEILSVSLHPGMVSTALMSPANATTNILVRSILKVGSSFLSSVEQGAKNTLWTATQSKQKVKNGAYYVPVGKESKGGKWARKESGCCGKTPGDGGLAEELWAWTMREFEKLGVSVEGNEEGQGKGAEERPAGGRLPEYDELSVRGVEVDGGKDGKGV